MASGYGLDFGETGNPSRCGTGPTSRIDGPDESQDLEELKRGCLAEVIALTLIGQG